MFDELVDIVVSYQQVSTSLILEYPVIVYNFWWIYGRGCVIPSRRYRPKGRIPRNFSIFYALVDKSVTAQGIAIDLKLGSLAVIFNYYVLYIDRHSCVRPRGRYIPESGISCRSFTVFYELMDVSVSSKKSDTTLRG